MECLRWETMKMTRTEFAWRPGGTLTAVPYQAMTSMTMNNNYLHTRSGMFALEGGRLCICAALRKASLSSSSSLTINQGFWV
jgi:hypothetical protein